MSHIWLVSGVFGAGKTTFCRGVAQEWRAKGAEVAGVLSPAVFAGEIKTGIDVLDLRGGESRRLATLRQAQDDEQRGIATQRWLFDPAAVQWGNQVLAQATPCDLLVVDELGPLEFERGQGWLHGLAALDSRAYQLALVVIRPHLLELALARWPEAQVKYPS